jgi:hypothetical protein
VIARGWLLEMVGDFSLTSWERDRLVPASSAQCLGISVSKSEFEAGQARVLGSSHPLAGSLRLPITFVRPESVSNLRDFLTIYPSQVHPRITPLAPEYRHLEAGLGKERILDYLHLACCMVCARELLPGL